MGRSVLEWENELSGVKDITRQKLKEIADAIRAKDGTAALMYPTDMPKRILALPQGADTSGVSIDWGNSSIAVILGAINDAISYKEGTAPGNVTPGVANDFASRILALKTASRLPSGYTELEWICPLNNASLINTQTSLLTSGSSIEIDAEIAVSNLGSYFCYLFNCYRVTSSKYYGIAVNVYSQKNIYLRNFNAHSVTSETLQKYSLASIAFPTPLTIKFVYNEQTSTARILWINGEKKSITTYSAIASLSTTKVTVGGGGIPTNTAHARSHGDVRIKSVKISNTASPTDTSKNADLVPCKEISSGNIGLYDLVKKTFYMHSSSSYKWGAGPEV